MTTEKKPGKAVTRSIKLENRLSASEVNEIVEVWLALREAAHEDEEAAAFEVGTFRRWAGSVVRSCAH